MDNNFLENLLTAVIEITDAERGLAVSEDLTVQRINNIDETVLDSSEFMDFANSCMQQALDTQNAVVTNNIITDISDAPTTNTNFSNLRVIVALPIKGHGAIYVDQHIRNGVISKEVTDKVMQLVNRLLDDQQLHFTAEQIVRLYHKL
ncbi:MAG: hypothetical protein RLP44_26390 [Aggregatilineales bacterium]